VHPAGVTFNARDGEVIAPDAVWTAVHVLSRNSSNGRGRDPMIDASWDSRPAYVFDVRTSDLLVGALLATVNVRRATR